MVRPATRAKKGGDTDYSEDQDLLGGSLVEHDDGIPHNKKASSRSTRTTPAKPVKVASMPAKTATLMDRDKTVVSVDMVLDADVKSPWMNVLNCLFSFIPDVKFDDGDTRFSMDVYELSSSCPDPHDANL